MDGSRKVAPVARNASRDRKKLTRTVGAVNSTMVQLGRPMKR